ncbi:GGDEF domain-containing protein [Sneathiella aquimaris]|uniref:GGDEF domain-containing protein n=1 Tax=Sneathiella aquimaris TaxID=2599305 RepID=UPI00146BDA78|nr:GGDEF domain-containing protein [Sneathiella aquimaris]
MTRKKTEYRVTQRLIDRLNQYSFLGTDKPAEQGKILQSIDKKHLWEDICAASALLEEHQLQIADLQQEIEKLNWEIAEHRDQRDRMEEAAFQSIDTAEEIHTAREELKAVNLKLKTQEEALRHLSITDPLTGIFNRRYVMDALSEIKQASPLPLSLFMIDIDHFKSVNDTYGHEAGDLALKRFTTLGAATLPEDAIMGRFGGEEFIVILKNTDTPSALILAEEIRQKTEALVISETDIPFSFTISVGIATEVEELSSVRDMISQADQAMYEAKNTGRNRIVVFNADNSG